MSASIVNRSGMAGLGAAALLLAALLGLPLAMAACTPAPAPSAHRDPPESEGERLGAATRLAQESARVEPGAIAEPAIEPSPFRREPWSEGQWEGMMLVSPNYRIRTTISSERFHAEVPLLMEEALRHYTTALGELPRPQRPMTSSIFHERSEWAAYTTMLLPREAATYLGIGRGGYTTDGESVLFDIGREDTHIIAVHEGWHQYTQTVFEDRLPTWLEEGIACWMEGHRFRRGAQTPVFMPWRNFERWGELRDALREDRLMPLRAIMEGTPQAALGRGKSTMLTYYAQVWALVHYLHDGAEGRHREALRQVVADAAAGRLGERLRESQVIPTEAKRPWILARNGRYLAMEYFTTDLEAMEREYRAFIEAICSRGAGQAIWAGKSPLDAE